MPEARDRTKCKIFLKKKNVKIWSQFGKRKKKCESDLILNMDIWKALNKEGHYNSSTSTLNNIQFSNIRFDVKKNYTP